MTKGIFSLIASMAVPLGILAQGAVPHAGRQEQLQEITDALRAATDWQGHARFVVSMPQLSNDVVYSIGMSSVPAVDGDSLSSTSYMLQWELSRDESPVNGFVCYISPGNLYRYDGHRLREHHAAHDVRPFAPGGNPAQGVHRTAQFVSLFPTMLADEIVAPAPVGEASLHVSTDTVADGVHRAAVRRVVCTADGEQVSEALYLFDRDSFAPYKIVYENNPGAISEQTVTITYIPDGQTVSVPATEQNLIDAYADVFSRDRDDSFRLLSMAGEPMIPFSAPMPDGQRMTCTRGQHRPQPAVLALLQTGGEFTAPVIKSIREAVEQLPFGAQVIYAFTDTSADDVATVTDPTLPGESVLINAVKLARDCGVTTFPALLLLNIDGTVSDVIPAYTAGLTKTLIERIPTP